MFFKKKALSEDYVELSTGTVFFYKITKRIVDEVERKAILNQKMFSVPVYFQEMEKRVVAMNQNQMLDLDIEDMQKLRKALKKLLIKKKLFKEEEEPTVASKVGNAFGFNPNDVEWFESSKFEQVEKLKEIQNARR